MPEMPHPDRLFPATPEVRSLARSLHASVSQLPIISPHGHTDPAWFAVNEPFDNPADLLIKPDHYIFRMLYSQGITLPDLGISPADKHPACESDSRTIWHRFAESYHLFQGTPSRIWLDHVFSEVFDINEPLTARSSDDFYDKMSGMLATPEFLPRALFERFNIEVIATTESPLDKLQHHDAIAASNWNGKVITTYRPDPVMDPDFDNFHQNVIELGELTGYDTSSWKGYLAALRDRREFFKERGATATDHGHPSAATANLPTNEAESLFNKVFASDFSAEEAEMFRAQMLTEMARMSLDDGLVMQIHPGSFRNHNKNLFQQFGRDMGADIPVDTDYVHALKPLLDQFGNERQLCIILFTLDETAYSRELAPLAGHYPVLKLGPAWWFHDSPEGMMRFREQTTETAGFYNTVGFNDDTRAFLSIPARHDMARRIDCGFLARLVVEHRLHEEEAFDLAKLLAYDLAKAAYKLG